jgi:hypothetical protein
MLKFSLDKKEDITGTFLTHKAYYALLEVLLDRFTLDQRDADSQLFWTYVETIQRILLLY